ncbi:hypothetical protein BKA66DRAFT_306280 [Pyrenochaeta sp. MPI-SDFR-AT-0127]|nr:hypothetical protein BKA66DRAFT_306280 [Pyrenochaeta sp. MPI-SDFR-AT-0127]
MHVDAGDGSPLPSSTVHDKSILCLVVAVMLVSIALLIFSLRVYTCGRLLRFFGIDDWIAMVAALSTIGLLTTFGCLVNLGFAKHSWNESPHREYIAKFTSWLLAFNLLHLIGIGFLKLSIAFQLLRVFDRKYCPYLLYGIICIMFASTLVWFGSALLQCIPVAAAWNSRGFPEAHCMVRSIYMTLSLVNNSINSGTSIVLLILLLPIICGRALRFATRLSLTVLFSLGLVACIAAIIRTRKVYFAWKAEERQAHYDVPLTVWSIVELTTALMAASLSTLKPLASHLVNVVRAPKRHVERPEDITATHSNHSSHQSRYSSQTVIYRPNAAHLPSLTRFHDDVSNLDFDIETPVTRTRTHTIRSRVTHSRNVSDWSQFSGFTYYTDPAGPPGAGSTQLRSAGVSMTELEEIVKGLGLGRGSGNESDVRLAVTAMNGMLPHERDQEAEMMILRNTESDKESEMSVNRVEEKKVDIFTHPV